MNHYVHCHAIHEVTFFRGSTYVFYKWHSKVRKYGTKAAYFKVGYLLLVLLIFKYIDLLKTILHLKKNHFTQPKSYIIARFSLTMFLSKN